MLTVSCPGDRAFPGRLQDGPGVTLSHYCAASAVSWSKSSLYDSSCTSGCEALYRTTYDQLMNFGWKLRLACGAGKCNVWFLATLLALSTKIQDRRVRNDDLQPPSIWMLLSHALAAGCRAERRRQRNPLYESALWPWLSRCCCTGSSGSALAATGAVRVR